MTAFWAPDLSHQIGGRSVIPMVLAEDLVSSLPWPFIRRRGHVDSHCREVMLMVIFCRVVIVGVHVALVSPASARKG